MTVIWAKSKNSCDVLIVQALPQPQHPESLMIRFWFTYIESFVVSRRTAAANCVLQSISLRFLMTLCWRQSVQNDIPFDISTLGERASSLKGKKLFSHSQWPSIAAQVNACNLLRHKGKMTKTSLLHNYSNGRLFCAAKYPVKTTHNS